MGTSSKMAAGSAKLRTLNAGRSRWRASDRDHYSHLSPVAAIRAADLEPRPERSHLLHFRLSFLLDNIEGLHQVPNFLMLACKSVE